jgi:autotransporter-associated beta strand protein
VNAGKLAVITASSGGGNFTVADGATLEVQASGISSDLQVNNLTLGNSGAVTNNFVLGSGRSPLIPLVAVGGNLNLNGTVTVNVFGTIPAAGTYVLLQYNGTTGAGSFVAGGIPGIGTVTNDTTAQEVKLIVTVPGVLWDSGNTNNGAVIDPASGTWDLNPANMVWNSSGVNVSFPSGNGAIFAGADGAYGIKLGAAITASAMTFVNSGYTLTNDTPQSLTLTNSGGVPSFAVAAGKTMTIGTNVTVNVGTTEFFGNQGNTPGGTIIIENGGTFQENTGNTWVLDGAGSVISVRTGGVLKHASGGSGQLAIGAGNTGNGPVLSVDGGSVIISANNCPIYIASGVAGVAGTLTINSGTVAMPAGTVTNLNIGTQTGNIGTLNLNGGTLSVAQVRKGPGAIATNNFNGGTLKAVNATYGSAFMTGFDQANIRNGGLVVDSGGFNLTVDQLLSHSVIPGDNATDGGLTKIGNGTLILTAANTYTGPTVVSNGVLEVDQNIAGTSVSVLSGATLSGVGTVGAPVVVNANGTLSPGPGIATLALSSNLTLNGNIAVEVDNSVPTSDQCMVSGTLTAGAGTVVVTNIGVNPLAVGNSFTLFNKAVVNGAAVTISPAPGAGLAWSNHLAADGGITVVSAPTGPTTNANITSVTLSGTNMVVHGTNNNVPNTSFHYVVLSATNITTPLSNWTPVITNPFNANGTFDYTNPIVPGVPQQFIDVQAVP